MPRRRQIYLKYQYKYILKVKPKVNPCPSDCTAEGIPYSCECSPGIPIDNCKVPFYCDGHSGICTGAECGSAENFPVGGVCPGPIAARKQWFAAAHSPS